MATVGVGVTAAPRPAVLVTGGTMIVGLSGELRAESSSVFDPAAEAIFAEEGRLRRLVAKVVGSTVGTVSAEERPDGTVGG